MPPAAVSVGFTTRKVGSVTSGSRQVAASLERSQLTRNQASASALRTMVRTATPTTSASSVDHDFFFFASTRRGGSLCRNGTTSMGALGAELELEVLRERTPFASFTLEWPTRGSPSVE